MTYFIQLGSELQEALYHPAIPEDLPVKEKWARFCDMMMCPGEWGDETCLLAACNVYSCSITVLSCGALKYHTYTPSDGYIAATVFLGHIREQHYVCCPLGKLYFPSLQLSNSFLL